jgi:bifunctional DNA primase/polymerase-like protein
MVVDQHADPVATLCVASALVINRLGMAVGDDWGVSDTGVCQCPRRWQCQHPGKHPARRRPREHATRDPVEACELARMGRNLAVYPDHRHVIVDVEMGSGRDGLTSLRTWAELSGVDFAELTDTLTVRSGGGGLHFYYWLPWAWRSSPPRGMDHWLPDVDTKSCVKVSDKATLPGSRHWTGGVYTFDVRPDGSLPDPRRAPEPLLRAMAAGRRWVPLPAESWPLLETYPPTFADIVEWSTPWRHARILRPDEVGPPPPSGVRYSGSDVDTSGWDLPAADPRDGTPS